MTLIRKDQSHEWTVSDILHVAAADDVHFLIEAANEYPRLRRIEEAAQNLMKFRDRIAYKDGPEMRALREALDGTSD